MPSKVVLIIGAGCTVADVCYRPKNKRPPLDKNFFSISRNTNPAATNAIATYVEKIYNMDIFSPENDSLERIMVMIYTDVFDPTLRIRATEIFRNLVGLFNRRLADTTNSLPATQQRFLYRIVSYYLNSGVKAEDITIVTFNQDLQIEKILRKIQNMQRYSKSGKVFNFPYFYGIDIESTYITSPTGTKTGVELFEIGNQNIPCSSLLKLHGSLNWYSTHRTTSQITPSAMFKPNRQIRITLRQMIEPNMRLSGKRSQNTLPIIVPPVMHKSTIMHDRIKPLWTNAEKKMKEASEIVIFGYSCPPTDSGSCNLFQRTLRKNTRHKRISVIDPNSEVLTRYINLFQPWEIHYYSTATNFLEKLNKRFS